MKAINLDELNELDSEGLDEQERERGARSVKTGYVKNGACQCYWCMAPPSPVCGHKESVHKEAVGA